MTKTAKLPYHSMTLERYNGVLSVVERYEGQIVKICADANDVHVEDMAAVARAYARNYGATYVCPILSAK